MATTNLNKLTFEEYQDTAMETAIYPNVGHNFVYPALGLCGEAGEIAEKIKKIMRDNDGEITDEARRNIAAELGDELWYIAALCHEFGLDMEHIAKYNLAKLSDRHNRNALHGSGDNR